MLQPKSISLENDFVRLLPLAREHAREFAAIGRDDSIWTYLRPEAFQSQGDAEKWIDGMLSSAHRTGDLPYSVFDKASGQLAGSTSLMDIRLQHQGVEIGYTWYGTEFQRSHVNTATKLLLFTHAFETLFAQRVQLQTDARNERSQAAIARIGATREGVLRKHKTYPSGFVRDSVMFSVIAEEWPAIRVLLQKRLHR